MYAKDILQKINTNQAVAQFQVLIFWRMTL